MLEDADLLFTGAMKLPADFWETHAKDMESWKAEQGRTFYRVTGPLARTWFPNQFLYDDSERAFEAIVRKIENDSAVIETARDFRGERHAVWGMTARNREQNFALNLLMDADVDFVSLWARPAPARPCSRWPRRSPRHWKKSVTPKSS